MASPTGFDRMYGASPAGCGCGVRANHYRIVTPLTPKVGEFFSHSVTHTASLAEEPAKRLDALLPLLSLVIDH